LNALATTAAPANFETVTYRKIAWRIVPYVFLLYVIAFLDRVNVSYAKLQMSSDLGFSETVYGFGAGMFFIGYFFLEIPSNLILHRVGARVWIARILIVWGIISACFMFVRTPMQFYVMRFLLGMGEAGFFPGIILYLTYWFPAHRRARMTATFMTAIAISGVIGGPLSGWIMKSLTGVHGLPGWQTGPGLRRDDGSNQFALHHQARRHLNVTRGSTTLYITSTVRLMSMVIMARYTVAALITGKSEP
jgi:MFS family permease